MSHSPTLAVMLLRQLRMSYLELSLFAVFSY